MRQSVALFIGPLNSATGLGIATISPAFACAQLMWGITQPIAGAVADKYGTGRVVATGAVLVMLGTVLTPHATSAWMLVLLIGVVAAGGGGMAGLGVLMSAVSRVMPPEKRGLASGMVNAGGSLGQFVVAPLAALLTGAIGWVGALSALGFLSLAILPLAWVLRGAHAHATPGAAPEKESGAGRMASRLTMALGTATGAPRPPKTASGMTPRAAALPEACRMALRSPSTRKSRSP